MAEADGLDASDFADACVDTTDVPAPKVAALVRESSPDWPGFRARGWPNSPASFDPGIAADTHSKASYGQAGNILLICGPTGVGKSTIGFGGQPDAYLRQVADQAAADAERMEHARFGTLRIDTDGRSRVEAAALIAAATGWPG